MSTRFLLIRHASVDAIGRWLAGCNEGLGLNEQGRMEAEQLAGHLSRAKLDAIYSSPLERAQQTAYRVAKLQNVPVITRREFTDIDFGDWTGKSFSELEKLPEWHDFNRCRSSAKAPNGESLLDVLDRMVNAIESLREPHEGQSVAIFSHCDPIRAAVIHYIGMPLDSIHRIIVEPASVSILERDECGARVLALNAQANGVF